MGAVPEDKKLLTEWGTRLRARRLELGRTQDQLAAESGRSQQAVSRLEAGLGAGTEVRRAVARALQVEPSELFPAYPEDLAEASR